MKMIQKLFRRRPKDQMPVIPPAKAERIAREQRWRDSWKEFDRRKVV